MDRVLDGYYDRYAMNVVLDGLDITLYLLAPNHINNCGAHLGKIYRIFNDISNLIYIDDGTIKYTFATHTASHFVNVLIDDKNGGIFRKHLGGIALERLHALLGAILGVGCRPIGQ